MSYRFETENIFSNTNNVYNDAKPQKVCISVLCVLECERWKSADNTSAENGEFYPFSSVANCFDLCLSRPSCVAIDIWSDVCSLHLNTTDLLSNRLTPGVSQFLLDRSCPVTTVFPTMLETSYVTSLPTTGAWAFSFAIRSFYIYTLRSKCCRFCTVLVIPN